METRSASDMWIWMAKHRSARRPRAWMLRSECRQEFHDSAYRRGVPAEGHVYISGPSRTREARRLHASTCCVDRAVPVSGRAPGLGCAGCEAPPGAHRRHNSSIRPDSNTSRPVWKVPTQDKGRPAINSSMLNQGRQVRQQAWLASATRCCSRTASGSRACPAIRRRDAITQHGACREMMDEGKDPMAIVFWIRWCFLSEAAAFGRHYIEAVRDLHKRLPGGTIFGGHSNVSFGLPERNTPEYTFWRWRFWTRRRHGDDRPIQ